MRSRHKPLYRSGFSMVEVLVALLLTSIGVLGVIAMQDEIIQYTADLVERNKVAMLGSSLLESMRVSPKTLYDVKSQMVTQSGFFKAKGSTFSTVPSSYTSLPDVTKNRLGCWAKQVKGELLGAGNLLKSDCYICHSSRLGDCDGKGSMLEAHLAWHGKQNACISATGSNADTSPCYYTLRVEP